MTRGSNAGRKPMFTFALLHTGAGGVSCAGERQLAEETALASAKDLVSPFMRTSLVPFSCPCAMTGAAGNVLNASSDCCDDHRSQDVTSGTGTQQGA